MGTVIPLHRGEPRPEAAARVSRTAASDCAKQTMKAAGLGLVGLVRYTVFLVLLFLRRPIQFVLRIFGGGGLLVLFVVAIGFSGPDKGEFLCLAGGMAAIGMCGSWFYDVLLLRLSPRPIVLI
jgi:hypothetical protein